MTKKKRHDPLYSESKDECVVKCSCGRFAQIFKTKNEAKRAWNKHYKIEKIKEED